MLDLEPIKARELAATAGPWEWAAPDPPPVRQNAWLVLGRSGTKTWVLVTDSPWEPKGYEPRPSEVDAAFIASSRADVPALVAEVERLRAAVARAAQLCYAHPSLADEIRGLA